jgi:hypothetical protein
MLPLKDTKLLLDLSYETNATAREKGKDLGYILDEELSTKNHKVFLKNGKPYIVYRGTASRFDIGTDLKYFVGAGSHRQQISNRVNNRVEQKYSIMPVLLGHSAGGGFAQQAANKNKQEVITYNKISTPRDYLRKKNTHQTNMRTHNDPVSALLWPKKSTITFSSRSYNPLVSHSTRALKTKNRR